MSREDGLSSWRGRLVPVVTAALAALFAGCHFAAVPLVSAVLRPRVGAVTPADSGLAYRDVVYHGAQGVRLPAWLVSAEGPGAPRGIVVLLAENGGTRAGARMLWLASIVSQMGLDALLVELRGHGDASGVNTYGLGETLDLLSLLRALEREEPARPIAAVGFSLGAACILRAMSVSDSIRGAVVMASYSRLDRDLLARELAYQTQGSSLAGAARLISPGLLLAAIRMWSGFARLPEPMDLVTDRPVLLFHCTGDPEIPFEDAETIAARAAQRGVAVVLRPIPRDQHVPPLSDAGVWVPFAEALRERLVSWFPRP